MVLIADSGSTKTAWCLADKKGRTINFETEGFNPCYTDHKPLAEILLPSFPPDVNTNDVSAIAFYGAGVYESNSHLVSFALQPHFPNAKIEACMDLIGSARSLLGHSAGFAAILGTGCNSCLYDGKDITFHIDSLGFMLGDEGSGGYMGKKLIGDYIRGYMPEDLRSKFHDTYRLSNDMLIQNIYGSPTPNRYCASFTRFLTGENAGHEYLEQHIIRDSFRDFFRNIVSKYPEYQNYIFSSVGSVGWIFRTQLTEVAAEFGMQTGNIIANPMEGLVTYHISEP